MKCCVSNRGSIAAAKRWGGVSVLAACLLATGCDRQSPAADAGATHPLPVVAVKSIAQDVPIQRTYPGTTQSPAVVQIDARVKGYLQERLFEEGADIEKGALLYRIQPEQYAAQVSQAEADVQIAESNLHFAKTEYARNEPLSQSGAISKQAWDRIARTYADAQGKLAAAEANLTEAKLNLSYTEVASPLAGRIGATRVDVGNLVGPGTPEGGALVQVVQLDPMRVVFWPAADEYAAFVAARAAGDVPTRITIPQYQADALVFDGSVDLLDNTAQSNTSTFLARAQFASTDRGVLPGQYASVQVKLGTIQNAVLVPNDALYETPKQHYVFVVKPDDTVERRVVEVAEASGGMTRIVSGLDAGQTVVVSASPMLLKSAGKVAPNVVDAATYLKDKAAQADAAPGPAPAGKPSGNPSP